MSVVICYDYKELCSHLLHVSATATTQILYFVYLISPVFVGYSQRKKEDVIRDYALPVVTTANKNCKVLWCIYLSLQDPLFGFNKLASQKFAHLNSSCLPYGSKLNLAKRNHFLMPIWFSCTVIYLNVWGRSLRVCWGWFSWEVFIFNLSFILLFFFLFPRKFFCRRTQNKPKQNQKPWTQNLIIWGKWKAVEKWGRNIVLILSK